MLSHFRAQKSTVSEALGHEGLLEGGFTAQLAGLWQGFAAICAMVKGGVIEELYIEFYYRP